jgi:hypothetical protein
MHCPTCHGGRLCSPIVAVWRRLQRPDVTARNSIRTLMRCGQQRYGLVSGELWFPTIQGLGARYHLIAPATACETRRDGTITIRYRRLVVGGDCPTCLVGENVRKGPGSEPMGACSRATLQMHLVPATIFAPQLFFCQLRRPRQRRRVSVAVPGFSERAHRGAWERAGGAGVVVSAVAVNGTGGRRRDGGCRLAVCCRSRAEPRQRHARSSTARGPDGKSAWRTKMRGCAYEPSGESTRPEIPRRTQLGVARRLSPASVQHMKRPSGGNGAPARPTGAACAGRKVGNATNVAL